MSWPSSGPKNNRNSWKSNKRDLNPKKSKWLKIRSKVRINKMSKPKIVRNPDPLSIGRYWL